MDTATTLIDENLQRRLDLVRNCTIYEVIHGSHAYGMQLPTSDEDIKGIAIMPDPRYYFGLQVFEQQDGGWGQDKVIYHLPKFMRLAGDCNPNIIEVLCVDQEHIIKITHAGLKLRESAHLFLSKKARHTFSGYAVAQLKRIEAHKRWIDNPPDKPDHEDFVHEKEIYVGPLGTTLTEGMKVKNIRSAPPPDAWQFDAWALLMAPFAPKQFYEDYIYPHLGKKWYRLTTEVFDKSGYESKKKDWEHYTRWRNERNEKRAELERQHSYDTKHAAHLVRLMRMGYEILTEGVVHVKRPDAAELLAIRGGSWPYEKILAYAEEMDAKLAEAEKTSSLPYAPQWDKIEQLQMELIEEVLGA